MLLASTLFTATCVVAFVGVVASEWFGSRRARAGFKILASSAFLAVAVALPAAATAYGRLIVLALALSWVGDVCLLSTRAAMFLSGLAAFLAAHLAFAVAFARGPIDGHVLLGALAVLVAAGVVAMRWLWASLSRLYKSAVGAYVAAILGMCALAIASSAASGDWLVAVGALGFAASDVAVARDQFIKPGAVNKLWGLPVYYVSQLILAWSVSRHAAFVA